MQVPTVRPPIRLTCHPGSHRLGVQSTNALYRVWDGHDWLVVKVYRPYPPTLSQWMNRLAGLFGRAVPAQYQTPEQRCRHERRTLQHWGGRGFLAPRVLDVAVEGQPPNRVLVLEYLQGPKLGDLLRARPHDPETWHLVDSVIDEMAHRHQIALQQDDPLLAHLDANTGNVILDARGVYRVDLESSLPGVPVVELLAREVVKLCRWIARDLGPASLEAVMEQLVARYHHPRTVLEVAARRTGGRLFSRWHRRRDRCKKARMPSEVTKYDVTDRLAAYL